MVPFEYVRAGDVASAVELLVEVESAQYLAGGTSQIDLMKEGVSRPERLVDVSRLEMNGVALTEDGGLEIGANERNAAVARHGLLDGYGAVQEALHSGASQQIRNVATMAGNLLQRTRCPYLRHMAEACNKRDPGSGCSAISGFNRMHAVFGATDLGGRHEATCIAVHPSDLAVALAAHDASVAVEGVGGARRYAMRDLLRQPGLTPMRDANLQRGDLITAIRLPHFSGRSHYIKVRDRASYAFGLVSCAIAIELQDERMKTVRIALGGVASKPWRLAGIEAMLIGEIPTADLISQAALEATRGAHTYPMNDFKIPLIQALVRRGLMETLGLEAYQGPAGTAFAASIGGMAGLGEAA